MKFETTPIGLTKREHFAALILSGVYANAQFDYLDVREAAKMAIKQTDVLIELLAYPAVVSQPIAETTNHEEFYITPYSTEFVKIPESPELDALRNELYRDEILLGGGDDD